MCHTCSGAGTTMIREHLSSSSSDIREKRPKYEVKFILRLTYLHYKG